MSNGQPINGMTLWMLNTFRVVLLGTVAFLGKEVITASKVITAQGHLITIAQNKAEHVESDLKEHRESMKESPLKIKGVEDEIERIADIADLREKGNTESHARIESNLEKVDAKVEEVDSKLDDILAELRKR